ncbi:hypothetical protein D3C71_2244290 [compost metagenome]
MLKLQGADGSILVVHPQRLINCLIVVIVSAAERHIVLLKQTLQTSKRIEVEQRLVSVK